MAELSDDDILAELGVDMTPKKTRARTPREERIIAGFEDIVKFREEHGRAPEHGEDRDIFERIYAVRLDRLRALPESRALVAEMDEEFGLLEKGEGADVSSIDDLDDSALLVELGVSPAPAEDITKLRNVRSNTERKAAEQIASAERCENFETFKPLFDQIEADLASGARVTRRFGRDAGIDLGDFFILRGQLAYVAEVGELTKAPNGQNDARLRVIYSNGTESNLLRWSLQRALYKDESGRRVTQPDAGPLFDRSDDSDHLSTGTLYVLRSQSTHPTIAANRNLIHKIGITGGAVGKRISGASDDATYLLAGVDIVATYKLFEVNRPRLEGLIHRVLESARFDIEIPDRFGKMVRPREWFLVPLPVIDEIVHRISDGTLIDYRYDIAQASLVRTTA